MSLFACSGARREQDKVSKRCARLGEAERRGRREMGLTRGGQLTPVHAVAMLGNVVTDVGACPCPSNSTCGRMKQRTSDLLDKHARALADGGHVGDGGVSMAGSGASLFSWRRR